MNIITPFSLLLYPAKLLKLKINLKDLQEYITMSIYTYFNYIESLSLCNYSYITPRTMRVK